jgi:hypothetical protein
MAEKDGPIQTVKKPFFAEAAKMSLSHKEGFAARSSKITPWKHADTHLPGAVSLKRIDLSLAQGYRIFGSISL